MIYKRYIITKFVESTYIQNLDLINNSHSTNNNNSYNDNNNMSVDLSFDLNFKINKISNTLIHEVILTNENRYMFFESNANSNYNNTIYNSVIYFETKSDAIKELDYFSFCNNGNLDNAYQIKEVFLKTNDIKLIRKEKLQKILD